VSIFVLAIDNFLKFHDFVQPLKDYKATKLNLDDFKCGKLENNLRFFIHFKDYLDVFAMNFGQNYVIEVLLILYKRKC